MMAATSRNAMAFLKSCGPSSITFRAMRALLRHRNILLPRRINRSYQKLLLRLEELLVCPLFVLHFKY